MDSNNKDEYYTPPQKLSRMTRISKFIYDPATNRVVGRTPSSWAKIVIFYICFYTVLSAYWMGLWVTFRSFSINEEVPHFQLKSSLIGENPGLGYRPMPSENHVESSLIWYTRDNNGFVTWTRELDKFLELYHNHSKLPGGGENLYDCDYKKPAPAGKVCNVSLEKMHPCNGGFYSYDRGSPCIFLKLNKIFNWNPIYYNDTTDLPTKMPEELQRYIKEVAKKKDQLNTVWVTCEGENPADKENIGPIEYFPDRGFPEYYFPFTNVKGYLSPLIAVWFENPRPGVLINIECKAWAKNIVYDRHDRRGSVHFEIMID